MKKYSEIRTEVKKAKNQTEWIYKFGIFDELDLELCYVQYVLVVAIGLC